jgi:HSP20 family protein
MAVSRWSPVGELASLHTAMDGLFRDFFGNETGEYERAGRPGTWYLPLDILDKEGVYEVRAAVPGFKAEEVDITVTDGTLTVVARRKTDAAGSDGKYLRRELRLGNYARSVQLPGGIRPEDIRASFDDGILTIEIPKAKAPRPVKIEVGGKSQSTATRPAGAKS